jgi:hypothetical protein
MPTPPRTCNAPVLVDTDVTVDTIIVDVPPIVVTPSAPATAEPILIVLVDPARPAVPILITLIDPAAVAPDDKFNV